jgi:hypothetical protein
MQSPTMFRLISLVVVSLLLTAPPVDGDPFTDSQEYPTAFQVGKVRLSGGIATVAVSFSGPEAQKESVHVVLVPVKGAWLIHDVQYVSGPSFRTLLAR